MQIPSPQIEPYDPEDARLCRAAKYSGVLPITLAILAGIAVASLPFRHALIHIACALLLSGCVAGFFWSRPRWTIIRRAWFPGLWMVAGFIAWQITVAAFTDGFNRYIGLRYHGLMAIGLLLAITSMRQWRALRLALALSLLLATILMAIQFIVGVNRDGGMFRIDPEGLRFRSAVGWQYRPWVMSYIAGLSVLWALSFFRGPLNSRDNLYAVLMIGVSLLAVVMSSTRGIFLALVPMLLVWVFLRMPSWNKRLAVILGVAIMTGGLGWGVHQVRPLSAEALSTVSGRTFLWQATWDVVREQPLTGAGRGQFGEEMREAIVERFPERSQWAQRFGHPHQDYLAVAGYYGMPAVVLHVMFLLLVFFWAWRRRHESPVAASGAGGLAAFALVAGLTENYFDHSASSYMFYATLAFFVLRHRLDQNMPCGIAAYSGANELQDQELANAKSPKEGSSRVAS
ncbi:MAG: O-antigen ligase family protein [Planctomycetota bacterium]|nr:MAG: O-antigen ligase family protein [Planctomycetota bacterium]